MELLNIQSGHQNNNIGQHGHQPVTTIKIAETDQEDKTNIVPISSGTSWKVTHVHMQRVPLAMHGVKIDAKIQEVHLPYKTQTMTRLSSVITLNCGAEAITVDKIKNGEELVKQQQQQLIEEQIPNQMMIEEEEEIVMIQIEEEIEREMEKTVTEEEAVARDWSSNKMAMVTSG